MLEDRVVARAGGLLEDALWRRQVRVCVLVDPGRGHDPRRQVQHVEHQRVAAREADLLEAAVRNRRQHVRGAQQHVEIASCLPCVEPILTQLLALRLEGPQLHKEEEQQTKREREREQTRSSWKMSQPLRSQPANGVVCDVCVLLTSATVLSLDALVIAAAFLSLRTFSSMKATRALSFGGSLTPVMRVRQ